MAVIAPTITEAPSQAFLVVWSGLAAGDTGEPISYLGHADRTVQVVGNFGGATVALEGSLDGQNWATLNDAQGTPISITQAAIEAVTEMVWWIRPKVTGGSAVALDVKLLLRQTR